MNELKYTKDHEWILVKNDIGIIGITNHAQESLGDIVYIELPQIGKKVDAGSEVSVIESVKAASDIYSPLNGEIIEINSKLSETPSLINSDPENDGWIFKIKINKNENLSDLMNNDQYLEFLKTSE